MLNNDGTPAVDKVTQLMNRVAGSIANGVMPPNAVDAIALAKATGARAALGQGFATLREVRVGHPLNVLDEAITAAEAAVAKHKDKVGK